MLTSKWHSGYGLGFLARLPPSPWKEERDSSWLVSFSGNSRASKAPARMEVPSTFTPAQIGKPFWKVPQDKLLSSACAASRYSLALLSSFPQLPFLVSTAVGRLAADGKDQCENSSGCCTVEKKHLMPMLPSCANGHQVVGCTGMGDLECRLE